jgi:hypothetical protein
MKTSLTVLLAAFFICTVAVAVQAQARQERFEVSSVKAVRPTLERTIAALEKKDVAGAKAAFEAYDNAWNGIEVYINRRFIDAYNDLEHNYQERITKGLNEPNPNVPSLTADAKAMLAKYDETVARVEKAPPLNPLYDDVARMRIVRAYLRPVGPALKAGDLAKARASFDQFHHNWEPIEEFVAGRSRENFEVIEMDVHQLLAAFNQDKPNVEQITKVVNEIMLKYNLVLAALAKEAQEAK